MTTEEHPREGMPWMPEETLLIMVEDPAYMPSASEAFDAIRGLREAAIGVVSAYASDSGVADAVAALEQALLVGIEEDSDDGDN